MIKLPNRDDDLVFQLLSVSVRYVFFLDRHSATGTYKRYTVLYTVEKLGLDSYLKELGFPPPVKNGKNRRITVQHNITIHIVK